MFDGNLSLTPNYNKVSPYSKVDTANGMPINNGRVVEAVNFSSKSKEYVNKENLRNIFSKNLTPSNGSTTEQFIKSRFLFTPVYNNNEARSKYEMISKIENKVIDIRDQVELLA